MDDAGTTQAAPRAPRTERGRRTQVALLDAAVAEFGERGFHGAGITEITRRAGVAMGSFYTWFDSKDAIFRAAIRHLSEGLRAHVAPRLDGVDGAVERERAALSAFLNYVDEHQAIYRIIDEAEFVAPDAHRAHYETTVERIRKRLEIGAAAGELREGIGEVEAWAIAGMNVFLGLRYGVWGTSKERGDAVERANRLLAEGVRAG